MNRHGSVRKGEIIADLVGAADDFDDENTAFPSMRTMPNMARSQGFGAAAGDQLADEDEMNINRAAGTYSAKTLAAQRLAHVGNIVDEYFNDHKSVKGFIDPQANAANSERPTTMKGLADHLRSIPFAGHVPTFAAKEAQASEAKAKTVASAIMDIEQQFADSKKLHLEIAICLLSTVSVVLMFIQNVLAWIPRTAVPKPPVVIEITRTPTLLAGETAAPTTTSIPYVDYTTIPLADRISSTARYSIVAIIWTILVLSIITIIIIIMLYRMIVAHKRREWCMVGTVEVIPRAHAYQFWRSWRLQLSLFLEIGVHLVLPYPWYNILHNPEMKYVDLFMLLRLYTVLRLLHHGSQLYRFRREILRANTELRLAHFTVRLEDTLKLYFFRYTFFSGLLMYLVVSLMGGFVVYVAERDSNNGFFPAPSPPEVPEQGFNTLLDGIYFMVISIRTIGYGDLRPITIVGRIATVAFQFFGMAAESVLGSVVINKIAKTVEEKIVDEYLHAFSAWHELRVASAMLIQATWKTSIGYQCRHGKVPPERVASARRAFIRNEELRRSISESAAEFTFQAGRDVSGRRIKPRNELEDANAATQQIIQYITSAANDREQTQRNRAAATKGFDDTADLSEYLVPRDGDKIAELFKRMPYLKKKSESVPLPVLVSRLQSTFNPDANIFRWGREKGNSDALPSGFKPIREFSVTTNKLDRHGNIRRVPVGEGHKSDVRLQALLQFRAARQTFNQTAGSSNDHVVDRNLTIVFTLLVSASKKIKRNEILLNGLRNAMRTETDATDLTIDMSLGGGLPTGDINTDL